MSLPTMPATRRWRILRPVRLSTFLLLVLVVALIVSLALQRVRERQLRDTIAVYRTNRDARGEALCDALNRRMPLDYPNGATLRAVLEEIHKRGMTLPRPSGMHVNIPIYVDPIGLEESLQTMQSKVRRPASAETLPLGEHLRRVLDPLGLGYYVISDRWGKSFLKISSKESLDVAPEPYFVYRDVLR